MRSPSGDGATTGHGLDNGPLPRCPDHLSQDARNEWRRIATPLYRAGVLTVFDRAALAAYCQAWARWVEAERRLAETPALIKAPSGYPVQSPWLSIANKQMELMNRYMGELGLTPSARHRGALSKKPDRSEPGPATVVIRTAHEEKDDEPRSHQQVDTDPETGRTTIYIDDDI